MSATQSSSQRSREDNPVSQIKGEAREAVQKDARGATAMSLIKTARRQIHIARDHESKGDIEDAFRAFIKAAALMAMTMSSVEYQDEQRTKGGALRMEIDNFFREKLKAIAKTQAGLVRPSPNPPDPPTTNTPNGQSGGSIADRLRALQENGMTVSTSKRLSRDLSLPLSPSNRIAYPQPPNSNIVSPSPHAFVLPSSLGPPSPSSTPSSSPQLNHFTDVSGFSQAFPSIDEIDENPLFSLPSVPTGLGSGSNNPGLEPHAGNSAMSPTTSFRNFTVPIERPSSTPVTPTVNTFASRPASPNKSTVPLKPSGLSGNASPAFPSTPHQPRSPLPVKNIASPQELLSYIHNYNVLLIDVRSREEFDREHIKANAVVCMEPVVLRRDDVTGDSLENSLVIAPRTEHALFGNREKFELVAVYDQSSTSFGPDDSPLSILVRIIKEQAFKKILKRMPMMLEGGLDAWRRELGETELVRGSTPFPDNHKQHSPLVQSPNSLLFSPSPPSSRNPFTHGNLTSPPALTPTPRSRPDTIPVTYGVGPQMNHHPNHSSNSRSPAETSHPNDHSAPDRPLVRRPAVNRPNSQSISYTRSVPENSPIPQTNGSPITYPSFPQKISPTTSGNGAHYISSSNYDIASPPQASINPSQLSRKRSDYVDQSQEALSGFQARTQGGPKPPRIDSDYPVTYWSDLQIGTSGLKNLGNTCYMNAPIQCLSATVPFARFFTDGRWKMAINYTNTLGSRGKLAGAFAKLLHEMWSGDLPYLTPIDFRKSICQLKVQYDGSDQHDSQEFLSFLLDGIHEDLNRVIVKPTWAPTPDQEAALEVLPPQIASEQEWRAWRSRNDSLIVDFFQGQFRNRLQCLTCQKTSTTYNTFSILQLPIPHGRSGKVPIQRCLDAFFDLEILEKDDAWDCPRCKVKRRASKQLSLARLPPVLVIHLKRFEANGRFSDKVDTFVDFPMKSLDLTNFMPPPLPLGADRSQLNGGLPMSPDDPRTQNPPYRYDLYGVTNHYGNLSSGHYTAFIASRGGWMYCDDSSVKSVDPKQVVGQKAYVLFYKRTQT
ncbi:hypothetical protein BD779DRAFT_1610331 [Infundibulicybe gibba]|nr:hypothetical protein BD779DRAFT_1610331 [Infundibulicybe gibba]